MYIIMNQFCLLIWVDTVILFSHFCDTVGKVLGGCNWIFQGQYLPSLSIKYVTINFYGLSNTKDYKYWQENP